MTSKIKRQKRREFCPILVLKAINKWKSGSREDISTISNWAKLNQKQVKQTNKQTNTSSKQITKLKTKAPHFHISVSGKELGNGMILLQGRD